VNRPAVRGLSFSMFAVPPYCSAYFQNLKKRLAVLRDPLYVAYCSYKLEMNISVSKHFSRASGNMCLAYCYCLHTNHAQLRMKIASLSCNVNSWMNCRPIISSSIMSWVLTKRNWQVGSQDNLVSIANRQAGNQGSIPGTVRRLLSPQCPDRLWSAFRFL
jgi:hypothetical protein